MTDDIEFQNPTVLTAEQVAARLQISLPTLRRQVLRGAMPPPFYVGRGRRWRAEDIDAWLAARAQAAAGSGRPRAHQQPPATGDADRRRSARAPFDAADRHGDHPAAPQPGREEQDEQGGV